MNPSLRDVEGFLSNRRLALVGASLEPKDFSRALMRELAAAGYDAVPVNRRADERSAIDGRRVFARVGDIAAAEGPVDGALLMVPKRAALEVVRECLAEGITRLWFHRGAGPGAVDPEAVRLAREAGALVVAGECPLMFLPGTGFVHRLHGGLARRWAPPALRGLAAPRPGLGLVMLLAIVQLLIGFPALGGGGLLVADPSGGQVGLPVAWLASSPFSSYLVPGLLLFALGVCHVAGAIMTLRRRPVAGRIGLWLGLAMMAYIAGEWLWIPELSPLQFIYCALGLVEIGLGLMWLSHFAPRVAPLASARSVSAPPLSGGPAGAGPGAARA